MTTVDVRSGVDPTNVAMPSLRVARFDDGAGEGSGPSCTSSTIRAAAVRALLAELVTYPKPGLVSLVDRGSHADMDATTFVRSARALRTYFARVADLGRTAASFDALRDAGIDAEARMLRATGGVNAHRGAIFALGLLAAAAGRRGPGHRPLGDIVRDVWGDALRRHRPDADSHGSRARARHGIAGACGEAAAGFPHLYETVLPAYRHALSSGASANQARVHAFFASTATLDDTNLVHRGGLAGLTYARSEAERYLQAGGALTHDWRDRATAVHRAFVARRLSPGGSADLLAACLFVQMLDG